MKDGRQTRIGVVAADPLRMLGLRAILEESPGLVADAARLGEAMAAENFAAVVLDCVEDLPEVLARFRRERSATKVVVVGADLGSDHIQSLIAAGAKGFLSESANEAEIRMAMQVVLDGSIWAPRKVLVRLIEAGGMTMPPGAGSRRFSRQMTAREKEVLQLLTDGRTNRQIAESLGVEEVTIKAHLGRMLRKAGVKNRIELTLKAMAENSEMPDVAGT
jgi:DNA-binding NarL/FixJ family response regulator